MRTIYIMWLRQIKRYLRSRSRIIGSLAQPVLYLLSMGFGFGPVFAKAGAGNYLQFLAPGIVAMSVIFTSIFSGIEMIWDRKFGFLKETLVAPVPRWHLMIGRTLGGATVAAGQGLLVLVIASLMGFRPVSWIGVPLAFLVMLLVALLFTAMGTAIASVLEDMQGFQLIMNFLVMPLFFLSGALFPLQGLPSAMTIATRLDPLSYGVDALRGFLSNASQFGVGLDVSILAIVTVFFIGLGSYLFSKIEV